MRYEWVKRLSGEYRIAVLCQTLQVARSGYSAWLTRKQQLGKRACAFAQLNEAGRLKLSNAESAAASVKSNMSKALRLDMPKNDPCRR